MNRNLLFILILISALMISTNVYASSIRFFTHSLQEQTFIDDKGQISGKKHAGKRSFNLEVVKEMKDIMKNTSEMEAVPFARGFHMVQNEPDIGFFNVSRTTEREDLVKWVGPLQREVDFFFESKDNSTGIRTLEDAKKVDNICVLNGSIHETILKKNNFTNIHTSYKYSSCFKMLESGRVNLTVSASGTVLQKLSAAGVSSDKIQQTPVVLLESEGYIAFSKNIADETIQKWQTVLDNLKKSGKYKLLYDLYFITENE